MPHFLTKTLQQVSPLLSVPEMNLTSSFLFSSDQLEHALHLLLSPVSMQQVSTVQWVFEMIHSPLDLVFSVVKPAFFVVLHLQDPSLQCFPLRHNRNASVTGGRCEGGGDVVSVLTLLVGGVAQAFHDDRVVELRVQLGVEDVEGKDREEQVEVEREKRVKEGAPWMTMEMVVMRLRT